MKRRDFVIVGVVAALAGMGGLGGCAFEEVSKQDIATQQTGKRWGFVVDVEKFNREANLAKIISACHEAHNVPSIDNDKEAVKWIWGESFEQTFSDLDSSYLSQTYEDATLPVFCNHCDNPPCVRVCPTQATFKREDGIVDMDYHRCIGCRFCMAACPFGARSLNFKDPAGYLDHVCADYPTRTKGVVEKCVMCAERIDKGQKPLCAQASQGTILFGDLNDSNSEVRQALAHAFAIRRRASLGTSPSIYYVVGEGETHA